MFSFCASNPHQHSPNLNSRSFRALRHDLSGITTCVLFFRPCSGRNSFFDVMADPVALTALVVSLVALLATTGQLLQQYFATADGFRRCQPSVMGLWAKRTKLRFRWREFRFETIFCIPRIVYSPVHGEMGKDTETAGGNCSLINTPESLKASMTFPGWNTYDARKYYNSDELVCWVPLLAQYVTLRNTPCRDACFC